MRAEYRTGTEVRDTRGGPAPEAAVPTGIDVGVGSAVVVVAALAAAAVPASAAGVRLGLVAAALAGFAAVTVDLRAAAAVTVMGYLVFDGFLINELGELSWRGASDICRFEVLAVGTLVGLAVGAVRRWLTGLRRLAPVEAWANGSGDDNPADVPDTSVTFNEEEWHGAGSGVRAVDRGAVRGPGARGAGGGAAMSVENGVGLVLAVALTVFLVLALLLPEKF